MEVGRALQAGAVVGTVGPSPTVGPPEPKVVWV